MATFQGVTIKPGTDADVSAQVQAILKNPTTLPVKPTVTPTVPVAALKAPVAPVAAIQPAPATASSALSGILEETALANQSQYLAGLQQQAGAAETTSTKSLTDYLKNVLATKTKAELKDSAYSATVDPAKAELQAINNKILAEQNAARRAVQKLKENNTGMLEAGLNFETQRINDKSIERQADLSIIQMAKQGQFDSAMEIADRKIEAQFEREKLYNDALRFNYEQQKDTFDKKEQRAFEAAQSDREMALQFKVDKEKAKYEQVIRENDPLYKAQIANIYSQIGERNKAAAGASGLDLSGYAVNKPSDAKGILGALLANQSLPPAQRNQIAKGLAVLNKVEGLYNQGGEAGKFAGASPVRGVLSFINKGIPGQTLLPQSTKNFNAGVADTRQALINYITGAAYTTLQANDVNNYIPQGSNTDATNRARIEGLTNSVIGDIESSLIAAGLNTALPRAEGMYAADIGLTKEELDQMRSDLGQ